MAATAQSLAPADYEVILVDNASADHTRAIADRWPQVRYLYCPHRGLSQARNAGAHAARSPIVTYIDDDAIADPHLLEEVLKVFDAQIRRALRDNVALLAAWENARAIRRQATTPTPAPTNQTTTSTSSATPTSTPATPVTPSVATANS